VAEAIRIALSEVRRSAPRDGVSATRQPCIVTDVWRIVDATPDGHPMKYSEASLYLMALYPGARAMTMDAGMFF
jgi:hypothetical protein